MDEGTFERFVHEHQRMVHAIARQYVKDEHVAEDVAQEAFLRAHRSFDGLRDPSRVKTWLYSLTRNAAIDWLRAHKRRLMSLDEASVDVPEPTRQDNVRDEQITRVMGVLDDLREDYREIIMMRYFEGLSYKEIAEALGMTIGAVGEKLSRVRDMIVERCQL
ncbi:MAG: sigma-70 family RNA polymerase sigma factor [Planctomycetes bacterium]|nr:sigma-70 family RNA polymerase sigma factor [Planctomycetota bacterium]